MPKKKEERTLTRAQKTEATKTIIKELLAVKPMRHNELIDEVAKTYATRYAGEDTENANDVRGRAGSVLDIMKKESEIGYADGAYALKARLPLPPQERGKKTVKKAKAVAEEVKTEVVQAESKEEPVPPKKRGRKAKSAEPTEEKAAEPTAEAPVEEKPAVKKTRTKKAVKTPAVEEKKEEAPVEEKTETKTEKKTAPKKRTAKGKKEEPPVAEKAEIPAVAEERKELPVETPVAEAKKEEVDATAQKEEKREESREIIVAPKSEIAQKGVVMDMSFLFGDKTPKSPQKPQEKPTVEKKSALANGQAAKREGAPQAVAQAKTPTEAPAKKPQTQRAETKDGSADKGQASRGRKTPVRVTQNARIATADDKLRDSFLKKLRTLGGDYFEYYSVYLLERYSMKNGRRLEGLKISGGDHDGGIDGEIELTDKLGFRETIYIQSKNWDPEKGKEEKWVVGETLLQQFIGACACRQAKEGKQRVRGIFITTSRFTPEAKNILDAMSDTIVGYDGTDLYEAAKECQFGVVCKNGEWSLDERLLSGTKAFFQML